MAISARKGDWVQVHSVVLSPEERTGKLPEDTKNVPLEMWVKGYIKSDAKVGETVEVSTLTGRDVTGELVDVNPTYKYGFGEEFIPELLKIGKQVRSIVRDGE